MSGKRNNIKSKYIAIILVFIFIFQIKTGSSISEDSLYKIFLNQVLLRSESAVKYGYEFLAKYQNSDRVPDILFYLSFVEQDYFKNIILLKRIIFYHQDSIWWEDAFSRLMEIYSLHNNNEAVIEYYELYNKLSKTFKNKYRIEIIRLQTLYFLGKYEECRENIENILMVAMNKELLSYSLNCLGKIEKDQLNDKNKAYYYFFNNFYFYRENDFSFESLLNLYALAKGAEKLYLANSILSKKEFVFLDTFLKEEITEYSKKGKGYITSIPDNGFEKPYYYISCIVVLKKEINSTQFQDIFDKFKKILEINNYPLYFQETEKYYIYGVGPYHFYEDSLKTKNDLELKGIDCSIIALDYTF